jgi:hypothetical protein
MRGHRGKVASLLSLFGILGALGALGGCQSTHDELLARGYPPPYADGYQDGCASGRQAAGSLGTFKKDVPRYTREAFYSGGWDDGFRQCQAMMVNDDKRQLDQHVWSDRDRDWEQQKTQSAARAYRSQ